ncbi:MAG: BrnT family toxin [Caulobacteraceae bacterium]
MRTRFEWDEAKARANLAKHGVSFELARRVWDDPFYDLIRQMEDGEERWLAIGLVASETLLLVVHVNRGGDEDEQIVRIVSARKATRHERTRYEQQAP